MYIYRNCDWLSPSKIKGFYMNDNLLVYILTVLVISYMKHLLVHAVVYLWTIWSAVLRNKNL